MKVSSSTKAGRLLAGVSLLRSITLAQTFDYPSTTGFVNTTSTPGVCTTTSTRVVTISSIEFGSYYSLHVIPLVTPYSNGTNVTNYVTIPATSTPPRAPLTCGGTHSCSSTTPTPLPSSAPCETTISVTLINTALSLIETPFTEPASFLPTSTVPSSTSSDISTSSEVAPTTTSNNSGPPPTTKSNNPEPPPPSTSNNNAPSTTSSPGESIPVPIPDRTNTQQTQPPPASTILTAIPIQTNRPTTLSPPSIGPISLAPSGSGLLLPSASNPLPPGGVTIINSETISFDSQSSFVAIGTQTFAVPTAAPNLPTGFATLSSASGIILPNGNTLVPGSATIVSGTSISLSPSETEVVIGDTTIPLAPPTTTTGAIVLPDGETLTPGVVTTIDGVEVSLAESLTAVVVNGSTVALTASGTEGIGSYIWSGIGGTTSTSSSTPAEYTGGARGRREDSFEKWAVVMVVVVQAVM